MNPTYLTIVNWAVRAIVLYAMGVLGSKYPAVYNSVNSLVHSLNGQEAVIASLAGAIAVCGWSLWAKLKDKLHLKIALDLPKGSNMADVKAAADTHSVTSVITNPPK